eukprot:5944968-Pyramimonas_sp.AAC.1
MSTSHPAAWSPLARFITHSQSSSTASRCTVDAAASASRLARSRKCALSIGPPGPKSSESSIQSK